MSDTKRAKPGRVRRWIGHRLASFSRPPENKEQLIQLLRDLRRRSLLDSDALSMIEGVLQVSELQVRDIMIPRAHMTVIDRDDPIDVFLPVVIESAHSRFPVIGHDRGRW